MNPNEASPSDESARALTVLAGAAARLADLVEARIAPALDRIAAALERAPAMAGDPVAMSLANIRQAIEQGQWAKAEAWVVALAKDFPEASQAPALAEEIAKGRELAIQGRQARLDAARSVNDAEQVVAIRDELVTLIPPEAKTALDREILQWLMLVLQRRMRTGTVRADVAELAAKMAERFSDTKEGASLRAALPTLRRSAGLCARCGLPYRGIADACPRCTGTADPEEDEDFPKSLDAST